MDGPARLAAVETVHCLDCGKAYGKPSAGGTLSMNPGCPHCGYVGWLAQDEWVSAGWPRDRFGGDRPPRLTARSR
jgi:hypothetical protein